MKRPVDRAAVEAHKTRMRGQPRAHALRELREAQNLTQTQLAAILHVSQNRVSAFERGEVERAQIDTLRCYIEASAATYASKSTSATNASKSPNAHFKPAP